MFNLAFGILCTVAFAMTFVSCHDCNVDRNGKKTGISIRGSTDFGEKKAFDGVMTCAIKHDGHYNGTMSYRFKLTYPRKITMTNTSLLFYDVEGFKVIEIPLGAPDQTDLGDGRFSYSKEGSYDIKGNDYRKIINYNITTTLDDESKPPVNKESDVPEPTAEKEISL